MDAIRFSDGGHPRWREGDAVNLRYLEEFLSVANTLSFSKSAKELHVAQSTLSRRIQALERETGMSLFERTAFGVSLTPSGKSFYKKALRIQKSLADLVEETNKEMAPEKTVVRICGATILPSVSRFISTMSMLASSKAAPISFKYRKPHSFSDETPPTFSLDLLRKGEIDFAIEPMGRGSRHLDDFESMLAYREHLNFVTSVAHPLVDRKGLRLADLTGYKNTYLELFPKTSERYGADPGCVGWKPSLIEHAMISDVLEISSYLANLAEGEIVQFHTSMEALLPLDSRSLGITTLLDVNEEESLSEIYLMWRKDADPELVEAVTSLACEIAERARRPEDDPSLPIWAERF